MHVPLEISNFFLAMQAGKSSAPVLEQCFASDAIYEEPFTGQTRRHEGREAIMKAMALGWEMPMVDTRIEIEHVAAKEGEVHVGWVCHSPSLPGGKGSGLNRFVLKNGLITQLITTLTGGGQ